MNGYDFLKFGATGIAAPDMSAYDKLRALATAGAKYPVTTITGVPPLSFRSDGSPLISWSMLGNGQQTGTPTPDNIIMPDFCGKLVGDDWTIPITCAGQTVPVYLGQVQTVRKIWKLILTGNEEWTYITGGKHWTRVDGYLKSGLMCICSHYKAVANGSGSGFIANGQVGFYSTGANRLIFCNENYTTTEDWESYLADQYSAGHPVTVWYVPATPTTGVVNEPLAKIGEYADELSSADAGVTISTARGQNTLTVDTDLQPSSTSITGHIKPL